MSDTPPSDHERASRIPDAADPVISERESTTEATVPAGDAEPRKSMGGRFLGLIAAILILFVAVVAIWAFFGDTIQGWWDPPLVAARGRVYLNGEPLTTGFVSTQPEDAELMGAIGALNDDGEFELMTNGEPGAYLGRHKFMVTRMSDGVVPQPNLPPEYMDAATTPLEFELTRDADENVFVLNVEGEVPQVPAGGAGGGGPGTGGPPGGGGAPGGGAPFAPEGATAETPASPPEQPETSGDDD